jgi:hypothetical protein
MTPEHEAVAREALREFIREKEIEPVTLEKDVKSLSVEEATRMRQAALRTMKSDAELAKADPVVRLYRENQEEIDRLAGVEVRKEPEDFPEAYRTPPERIPEVVYIVDPKTKELKPQKISPEQRQALIDETMGKKPALEPQDLIKRAEETRQKQIDVESKKAQEGVKEAVGEEITPKVEPEVEKAEIPEFKMTEEAVDHSGTGNRVRAPSQGSPERR